MPNKLNRRLFLRSLAAALPAGAAATQVASGTDPVCASLAALRGALRATVPEGFKMDDALLMLCGELTAVAYPKGWEQGKIYALYSSSRGNWRLTA